MLVLKKNVVVEQHEDLKKPLKVIFKGEEGTCLLSSYAYPHTAHSTRSVLSASLLASEFCTANKPQ